MTQITNETFLKHIFGADWQDAHVCGFSVDPSRMGQLKLGHLWAGNRWGRLSQDERDALRDQNSYFCVSLFRDDATGRARRRRDLFRATHCLVFDDVGTKIGADVRARLPDPHWRLETSPGNQQWGYRIEPETSLDVIEQFLDDLIAAGLTEDAKDPGMKGVTRYMRLPEGVNTKAKYGGWRCRWAAGA